MAANEYKKNATYGANRRPKFDQIKETSKHDGLTMEQIYKINGILASRRGEYLSASEIGQINGILTEPGTASAAMGASWTPVQESASKLMSVPDRDTGSNVRTSTAAKKLLEQADVLGLVTFSNNTAMGRGDYGELSILDPIYVRNRTDLNKRAVAFSQYTEEREGQYSQKFAPIQVKKPLKVENNQVVTLASDPWVYEPWSESQFVDENNVINDMQNRHFYTNIVPNALSSDVPLSDWIRDLPLSRRQMTKLLTESGLNRLERGMDGNDVPALETITLSRKVADAASDVMNYLQNKGFTYELEVNNSSMLVARVNTGSGQYRVNVADLQRPSSFKSIGALNGNGLNVTVDRSISSTGKKGTYRKSQGVDATFDPTGPLRVVTGDSNIKDVAFNVNGYEGTHDEYVSGTSSSKLATSVVYTTDRRVRDTKANSKGSWRSTTAMVDVIRNGMVLDSDKDANVSLQEMIDDVNARLADANLPLVEVDAENGYAGLPLAAISQLYSRETVINALLKAGIDAEALRDPKYDAEVHLVMSDLAPLASDMFTEVNVDRVVNSVDPDDVKGSVRRLGLDDLRLLIEVSTDDTTTLDAANAEFYKRIGYQDDEDAIVEEEDSESKLENITNNTADDEKNIDVKVVPLKESLMTAMAGRFTSNAVLREHIVSPKDYTDVEAKWMSAIREKVASRAQIERPKSRTKEAKEAYLEDLKRVHIVLDDQHVVHWLVTSKDDPRKMAINPVNGKPLSGSIGQLFLPNQDGLIELDYTGGSKGYAVAGYNAYFVSAEEQLKIMRIENATDKKAGKTPRWNADEMDLKFLKSEDSLAYRIRLSGFDEGLSKRLDQLLTRQITLGIDDTLGDNVMLNRLYKGKDTYLTRITNDLVLSDKRLVKHLASRVYIDDAYFSDAGNKIMGRHTDENGNLVDLASKYTPESLSGTLFDKTNIAGLGNSHFLSGAALEMMEKGEYRNGRFSQHFQEGSAFQKDLALHPNKQFGLLLNEDENKYHFGDPTDRVSMAGNQQVHADSYVDNTKLALMTFKGYTMDDGNIITEKYAERVGREQAEMVADVRIAFGDYAYLANRIQHVERPEAEEILPGATYTEEEVAELRAKFIETMAKTSTREGGFKLAVGDKLSTFHGNKTTISHVVTDAETKPGKEFEMFGQNPELEVVMPPESIISRLNMGEVQELMDGQVNPVTYNDKVVGYYGETRMINTEIKAVNKMHAYGHGDGRHVGAQLLWMLNAREHSDVIIDAIYGDNGKAAMSLVNYMETTGVSVDPETGIMRQGLMHADKDLADPAYLAEHMLTVIDPTKGSASDKMLPANGGYIKMPVPIHLPNMAEGQVTNYLPVLPEALRQGQELPSGEVLEQDRTRRYKQIVDLIESGRGEETYKGRNNPNNGKSILQTRVDSLTSEIIRSKLGAEDGSANKLSHARRNVMGATVANSATAPATNNPKLPLDTIEVGPEVYETLDLKNPDQLVLMWRDPALHAGSVMSFKVKLNPEISGVGMNPVIATPFGGDFDGDTYGIYAPRYSKESQQVLREEYSVESYLKDMGKRPEDRNLVLTDVELNTGMDFTAGAVVSQVKNSQGEVITNKSMLEDELRTLLEKGAYEKDSDIVGDITKLWDKSQSGNIGADKINLIDRESMKQSMIDIAKIGAKGKVEVDDEGHVLNLKGLQDNMDRFDRLGYYDGNVSNRTYDHDAQGRPKYSEAVRESAQALLAERYATNAVDRNGRVKIIGHEKALTQVDAADRDIEKATVAKQLLTASSGQSAIDLNKTAVDIEDKTVSSRVSEMTQVLTQAALQVKHEAAIVPALNKGVSDLSRLSTEGNETFDEFLEHRQEIFKQMEMPEGYSRRFAEAAYESAAINPMYGDTNGGVEDASQDFDIEPNVNKTMTKDAVTEASSPLALLSYNGARYLKQLAASGRSLYEGNVSGKLVQALPAAYNRTVPESDKVPEISAKIATEYYAVNKELAQKANREVRDQSFVEKHPLAGVDALAKLRPSTDAVKRVVQDTAATFDLVVEAKDKKAAEIKAAKAAAVGATAEPKVEKKVRAKVADLHIDQLRDVINAYIGHTVPHPAVQTAAVVEAPSQKVAKTQGTQQSVGLAR